VNMCDAGLVNMCDAGLVNMCDAGLVNMWKTVMHLFLFLPYLVDAQDE